MQRDVFCGLVPHLNLCVYGSLIQCGVQSQIISGDIAWLVDPKSVGRWTGAYDVEGKRVFAPILSTEREGKSYDS